MEPFEAQKILKTAKLIPCKSCGSEAKVTFKSAEAGEPLTYSIECRKRFSGCPMNARTHRNSDVRVCIEAWNAQAPIEMILPCPRCGTLHIDEPEDACCDRSEADHGNGAQGHEYVPAWDNPPHKSHTYHCCDIIFRPADVCTVGVAKVKTRGSGDTWRIL